MNKDNDIISHWFTPEGMDESLRTENEALKEKVKVLEKKIESLKRENLKKYMSYSEIREEVKKKVLRSIKNYL